MANEETLFYGEDKWNDNHFVYQLETQQSILKALISKLKSDIDGDNKHEYVSKNENEKMLQRTQERLDQHRHQLEQKDLTA